MASDEEVAKFNRIWKKLARKGYCDSIGGGEYCRVKKEWKAMGRPRPIGIFIITQADIGPVGPGMEEAN